MTWSEARAMLARGRHMMRPHWHWCWLSQGPGGELDLRLVHEDPTDTEAFRPLKEDREADDWMEVPTS